MNCSMPWTLVSMGVSGASKNIKGHCSYVFEESKLYWDSDFVGGWST